MLLNCGVGEDLRVPWTARRSTQSILKEISPEHSLEGLMLKLKSPVLRPPDVKNWLTWKDPDAGKGSGQEEKGTTGWDGWHHQHNGHEFGWTLGVGDGLGGLACCSSWGCKELDTTEWLNWLKYSPCGSPGKESAYNVGNLGLIPGWENPLEKGMATHSSILAWEIPWTEEPGRLQSMGCKVRHDWVTSLSLFIPSNSVWGCCYNFHFTCEDMKLNLVKGVILNHMAKKW